jgi:hypothetical protein
MARPCPVFAIQGRTASGKSIRAFFSQCVKATTVISCYDLTEDTTCHCIETEKMEDK